MGIPHRNNPPRTITGRPNHHNQPASEITRRDEPRLAIILPVIRQSGVQTHEHRASIGEIKPPMLKRGGPLGRIKADFHRFIVVTTIRKGKAFMRPG
jgi:hypothetical protein